MAAPRHSKEEHRRQIAERLRQRYRWLSSFNDDELQEISICTLEEGETQSDEPYFDLSHPERGSFKGQQGQVVPEGSCYISRGQLPEKVWNKLVGSFRGR
ncbi:MAG: hypothetical protein HYY30_02880 [Chloroflexi bacterium]|nr:hypothetical protein [Chloroflexota bacterium]